jgi:hypothetical protein
VHHDAPPPDEMITFLPLSARASMEQNPATAGAGEDMQSDVVDEDRKSDEA